ncbi:uncharacterized protein F5891DRAFT_1187916 [Suillus fuscotomentosus]|uniref:Uncharacterized protein n=1 Tax=Suillus fuscotomentosus TaxID=1912939 RepID=A0AAD4E7T7_9AGAM|nr:uncharacterized protein F5891DRAFT_1187916 [Suillus fuscotomentosus]KAG1901221.1 hypothetical protein F5891DRAFT_1187916 [Suillus fuscotomentosus]
MNNNLCVFARDGQVYTSLTAHSLPDAIPYESCWDPHEDYDTSPDDSDTPLTTCWAYGARLWFPLIPLNPSFDGPIFGCLNHSRFSLHTEVDNQGKHVLHRDIRGKWADLEQKLLWCQERLGAGLLIPWGTKLPRAPTTYGYQRSHADANLAKKVAIRSRNAFLLIATTCSWHIMSHHHHGSNRAWMAILTDDPHHPIPAEWVLELSRSFQAQLPMFEKFSIPIWVCFPQNVSAAVNSSLCHYIPSAAAITRATEQWDQKHDNAWGQLDDSTWGQPEESQNAPKWDDALGWAQNSGAQPVSNVPEPHTDSLFPTPQPHSGQKRGEDWKAFFARRCEENKRKEETETPARQQSRQSRERVAMNHSIPGKSSTAVVFEWQPNDEFGGFCQRVRLTKAEIPTTWMSYSTSTRVYDSFRNQWDLCDVLDPSSVPDGDWEEDHFPLALAPSEPTPAPPPPPPPLSSFMRDIETYFGCYEVAPSAQYTRNVERFMSILHFHLGYRLAASTSTPRGRSTTFNDWTHKMQWAHLCKLVGDDPTNITSIPDTQKHVITCFIGYLVTLPQSQLSDIPPDLWDLGPNSSLSVLNAHIRVSYAQQPKQRFYIIELLSSNLVPWKLAVPDAITVVMCLRHDWGSDITKIVCNLLEKGIAIKMLQPISVPPHAWHPLMELHTYSLGHVFSPKDRRLPHFRPVYADYIVYKQHRHKFMNQPCARVALLHGGLIWRLALHSLSFNVLPSVLDGISRQAVPFGLMLDINGQTYFDDELSEEEVDFMCGMYHVHTNDGNVEIVSWWPRPQAWAVSGLNVGFWSSQCESWFQSCLDNIRQGVSRKRHKSTNDANSPMTGTQWKGSLKFNLGTSKMMKNVNAACCSFLDTKASAFTEN